MEERTDLESTDGETRYKVIIGLRLGEEREKKGLTQQKLA